MAYDEVWSRLGDVLMRYGLDRLAAQDDDRRWEARYERQRQEQAEERAARQAEDDARAARQAKLSPPQEREVEYSDETGKRFKRRDTWHADYDNPEGSAWQMGEPLMVAPTAKGTERRYEGDQIKTYRTYDDGSEEVIAEAPRYRPDSGQAPPKPQAPKLGYIENVKTGEQRTIALTPDLRLGADERFVTPGTKSSAKDRAAEALARFADDPVSSVIGWMTAGGDKAAAAPEAAAPAQAEPAAEKPVQVKTDKHGRKWAIYADGTMEQVP